MSEVKVDTIGKDYTLVGLAKFVAFPVLSRLVISLLQTLDDSLFISRYCGKYALAAFSIGMPFFMLLDAFGMLLSGIAVSASTKMGEKKKEEAKSEFTTMCIVSLVVGVIISILVSLFEDQILKLLGTTEVLWPYATSWISVAKFNIPFQLLSYVFGRFYVISGKPKFSAVITVTQTLCNFGLDYLFIVKLNMGIVGTSWANLIGNIVIGIIGFFFYIDQRQEICFGKMNKDVWSTIKQSIKFGKVDAFTSLALSVNSYITNTILLSLNAEDFVAAFTIVNNVQFMFMAAYFGLFGATNPLISYAYGEKNKEKLARIIKQNAILTLVLSLIICSFYLFSQDFIMSLYTSGSDTESIKELVSAGMKVTPFAFFFFGFNVMCQFVALALNDDKTSTILTFVENVIFSNAATILLSKLFGVNSAWYFFLVAEICTSFVTLYFVFKCKDKYGYGKNHIALEIEK